MKTIGWIITAIIIGASAAAAAEISLTIYSQNYAIVRETDTVNLEAGVNEIRHEIFTKFLLDEPIRFYGEGLQLLEQRYEYGIPTLDYMLKRNVGKQIELVLSRFRASSDDSNEEIVRGTLFSELPRKTSGSEDRILFMEEDGSLRTIQTRKIIDYQFISPPDNIAMDPTLVWKVNAAEAGTYKIEATYEVLGLAWDANYILDLTENDSTASFSCLVSVDNATGKNLEDIDLKLVYGTPRRSKNELRIRPGRLGMEVSDRELSGILAKRPGFRIDSDGKIHFRGGRDTEALVKVDGQVFRDPIASSTSKSVRIGKQEISRASTEQFLSMNLYHMPHRVTLKNEAATELSLIPQSEIKLKTFYEYFPRRGSAVNVQIKLTNADSVGLGIPLPPGDLKIYRLSETGTPEFVGQQFTNHLDVDQKRQFAVGRASDIKIERNQLDYVRHSDRKFDETWELKVTNKKDVPVDLIIYEDFPHDYKMLESTHEWQQRAQPRPRSVKLPMIVQPGQERVVRYTVRMTSDYDLPEKRQ